MLEVVAVATIVVLLVVGTVKIVEAAEWVVVNRDVLGIAVVCSVVASRASIVV